MKKSLLILSTLVFASNAYAGTVKVKNDTLKNITVGIETGSKLIELKPKQEKSLTSGSGKRNLYWTVKETNGYYRTAKQYQYPDKLTIKSDGKKYDMVEKKDILSKEIKHLDITAEVNKKGTNIYGKPKEGSQKSSSDLQKQAKESDLNKKIEEIKKTGKNKISTLESEIDRLVKLSKDITDTEKKLLGALLDKISELYLNPQSNILQSINSHDELDELKEKITSSQTNLNNAKKISADLKGKGQEIYGNILEAIKKRRESIALQTKAPAKTIKYPTEKEINAIKGKNNAELKEKYDIELEKVINTMDSIKSKQKAGITDSMLANISKDWKPLTKIKKYIEAKIKKIEDAEKKKEKKD